MKKDWMVEECVVQSQDRHKLAPAWGYQVPTNPRHTLSSCLPCAFLILCQLFHLSLSPQTNI